MSSKMVCNSATTLSIPNLALSRSYSFNSAVSWWMLPDLVHFHKDFDTPLKLTSCNVITLYPSPSKEFLMKSSDVTNLHHTKPESFSLKMTFS